MIIITTVFYFDPLRILLPFCIALLSAGVGMVAYQLLREDPNITTVPLLIIQTGLTLFALAIVSDLIVKSRNHTHVNS
jgi:hypothetical protein